MCKLLFSRREDYTLGWHRSVYSVPNDGTDVSARRRARADGGTVRLAVSVGGEMRSGQVANWGDKHQSARWVSW